MSFTRWELRAFRPDDWNRESTCVSMLRRINPVQWPGKIAHDGRMASPRSIEVKVGILILTAIGLLAAFVIIMGGVNFQPAYPIYVEFDNPGGLQAGAPVK